MSHSSSAESMLERVSVASRSAGKLRLASRISAVGKRVRDYAETAADYYAAAALYEQLSRLSDADLRRRGLSRDTLARDVCIICDRTARS